MVLKNSILADLKHKDSHNTGKISKKNLLLTYSHFYDAFILEEEQAALAKSAEEVDYSAVVEQTISRQKKSNVEVLENCFKNLDNDCNGFLQISELKVLYENSKIQIQELNLLWSNVKD